MLRSKKERRAMTHKEQTGFTLLETMVSLAVLFRWKVSSPLLIAATAVVGLIAYPLLQPAWVMVK